MSILLRLPRASRLVGQAHHQRSWQRTQGTNCSTLLWILRRDRCTSFSSSPPLPFHSPPPPSLPLLLFLSLYLLLIIILSLHLLLQNLAEVEPEVVEVLRLRLAELEEGMSEVTYPPRTEEADPGNFGGVWSAGWC